MELKFEFPTSYSNSIRSEFHEKVAIPFNRVFGACKNEFTGKLAFEFVPTAKDDPRIAVLSLTKILEPTVGRNIFAPRVLLSFYPNAIAVFEFSTIKAYECKKGTWREMFQVALDFIKEELEKAGTRQEEIEKISEIILDATIAD